MDATHDASELWTLVFPLLYINPVASCCPSIVEDTHTWNSRPLWQWIWSIWLYHFCWNPRDSGLQKSVRLPVDPFPTLLIPCAACFSPAFNPDEVEKSFEVGIIFQHPTETQWKDIQGWRLFLGLGLTYTDTTFMTERMMLPVGMCDWNQHNFTSQKCGDMGTPPPDCWRLWTTKLQKPWQVSVFCAPLLDTNHMFSTEVQAPTRAAFLCHSTCAQNCFRILGSYIAYNSLVF